MNQLTCSSGALPARATLLPGFEEALPTHAATSPLSLSGWLIAQGYDGRSGKTFLVSCQAGPEKILPASYRYCVGGKSKSPKEDGAKAVLSSPLPDVSVWLGEYLTLSTPEFPNFQGRSRSEGYLGSWIYPATVLFDGEMRGGDTPPRRTKRQAVAAGAEGGFDTTKSIRMRGGKPGGGKGILLGDDLSHTLATGNDQTIITLSEDAQWWDGSDQAETLTGTSNNQLMPDKGRLQCVIEPPVECIDMRQVEVQETELAPTLIATDYKGGKAVGIGRDVFNQGQNAKYGMSLSEDVQPTLTAKGPGAVCFEDRLQGRCLMHGLQPGIDLFQPAHREERCQG